jgi:ABC-2 type transport system permease protein
MPPFTANELTLGIALGGATRGVVVGSAVAIGLSLFVDVRIVHPGYAFYFAFMAALMLSLVGIMGGIWSEKFDHIAGITNFIVTPLSFLSGTFYSIHRLPEMAQSLAKLNPFFYMIDGFRFGFIGQSDSSPLFAMAVLAIINTILWVLCTRMFQSGYKLKP